MSAVPNRDEQRRSHFVVVDGDPTELAGAAEPDGAGPPNARTLSLLYEENPYAGLDPEAHPDDLQGWNSYVNVFRDTIEQVRPRRIVEVGVWKGTATIHMAEIVREMGLRCEIVSIDTWLGSPEHFLAAHGGDRHRSLRLRHGYPQLYYTFLANVARRGLSDYVVPLPLPSESAATVLRKLNLEADLVHVDAAHEHAPALRDFHAYWDLLSERGVLIGDDYLAKRSVTRAADEFAASVERPLCAFFPKFVIARSSSVRFAIAAR